MDSVYILMYVYMLLSEPHRRFQTPEQCQQLQEHILHMYTLYIMLEEEEEEEEEEDRKEKTRRRFWVRPIFMEEQRLSQGASDNLLREMAYRDKEKYMQYLRMSEDTFNKLLIKVSPYITKQYAVRAPIPAYTRLHITLRYLVSGDSMTSISFAFRVSSNTVSKIIRETCSAIWKALKDSCFRKLTTHEWCETARQFECKWDFPHCIGAVDGKLVVMQAPPNSGSAFYTYKKTFAMNLMAVADANYRFIIVDIGAPRRRSDGGVFKESEMGRGFECKSLNVPPPEVIEENGSLLPYVLVGDEAFTLSEYLMRPYPRAGQLDITKKVFNYRLSRARRVVESAFGILGARWRIYRTPIIGSSKLARRIIQATTCLHNWIITENLNGSSDNEVSYTHLTEDDRTLPAHALQSIRAISENEENLEITVNSLNASTIRDNFSNYFISATGAIPFQWERAVRNDF